MILLSPLYLSKSNNIMNRKQIILIAPTQSAYCDFNTSGAKQHCSFCSAPLPVMLILMFVYMIQVLQVITAESISVYPGQYHSN